MAQHFHLSAEFNDLSLLKIIEMGADEQIAFFARLRWGCSNKQVCPNSNCGVITSHYWRASRRVWRCRDCGHQFSVTSGTIFHGHKLSLMAILIALHEFTTGEKGVSALKLSKVLGCQWRTAWLLTQKLREVIIKNNDYAPVSYLAQMDGGHFGGKRRAPNRHGAQRDERAIRDKVEGSRSMRNKRRLQMSAADRANLERKKKRRCVCVLRQIDPEPGKGANRTLVYISKSENEVDMERFAKPYIEPGTIVMTDEGGAFTFLSLSYDHRTVVHSREYCSDDGINDNQAESYYSRLRRAEYGVHHGFRPMYLIDYCSEMAWREDTRRKTLSERFETLSRMSLRSGRSTWFSKYFQGNRRKCEILGPADGKRFAGPGAEVATEMTPFPV